MSATMVRPEIVQGLLQYFIMPVWIAAGVADWICHRVSRIENTAGPKESVLHLIMLAELGIPVCAALFLEINALMIAVLMGAFVAHQLTALYDLRYAVTRRLISPLEQQVHSFLELLPLMGLVLLIVLHWAQFLSLFGAGDQPADFSIRLKESPLSPLYIAVVLGNVGQSNWR